jgi:hypothetical protein
VGLRLALVGSELGERNNSQSLPTLYIYYIINLKKNQIIEFGVLSKKIYSLTHFVYILYTKIAKKSKFKSYLHAPTSTIRRHIQSYPNHYSRKQW